MAKENKKENEKVRQVGVHIPAPNLRTAEFHIVGTAPLVIHRFSQKTRAILKAKMVNPTSPGTSKKREPVVPEDIYNEARYISKQGWDGFNAASIRNAMIEACRLVDYKMVRAKMSVFVVAEGWDAKEPQIPLVRIIGKPTMLEDTPRVETGQPYVAFRPMYNPWEAKVKIRFDADQFTLTDVGNLLMRAGEQVGIGEGRPLSKNSAGMGWGTWEVKGAPKK